MLFFASELDDFLTVLFEEDEPEDFLTVGWDEDLLEDERVDFFSVDLADEDRDWGVDCTVLEEVLLEAEDSVDDPLDFVREDFWDLVTES